MMSIIDTNVIIRFLTGSSNEKFRGVYRFFKDLEDGKINVELKLIVLFQTIFVLKSFYQVPKFEIVRAVGRLLKLKGLKIREKKTITQMIHIWDTNNIEIVDAYLIACLQKDTQNILYSYDTDFDKFGMNRIEP